MNWVPRWLGAGSTVESSDEESMRRVQAGDDPAAFARLVARWEQPIRRLCIRMTGDEHRGEDLTQEAFARVFASRHQFDAERKFSTWLWRIALNLCHEEARRVGRRGERSVDMNAADDEPLRQAQGRPLASPRPVDHDEPHGRAVRAERAQLVRVALQRLPEANRAVVVLREYENLKFREIAEVLDVPEGTVKWRMAQALVQLGEQLKPILGVDEAMRPATRTTKERLAL
jgi:RNA polymerase sigma-70 factor, ECF subfamily